MIKNLDPFLLEIKIKEKIRKKRCSICQKILPITNFLFRNDNHKYRNECKKCSYERQKKLEKIYKEKNKKRNPYNNKLKKCTSCKKWKKKTKENWYRDSNYKDGLLYICKFCFNSSSIEKKYNFSKGDYITILKKYKKCEICGKKIEYNSNDYPCIDHDHKLEKKGFMLIRGILCQDCNRGLGCFQDNPFILINAIKYLGNKHKKIIDLIKELEKK